MMNQLRDQVVLLRSLPQLLLELQPQEPPQLQPLLGYQHSQVLHLVCTRLFQARVHALRL
jgi:hypothetical protein